MFWAKQSTAATVIVGPILDSAGAEYASAVIGDLSISKNGGTLTALASAASLTLIANGQYTLVLRTTDFDTLGRAQILCNKSTYQIPSIEFMVIPVTVYDALVTNATNTTGGLPAATAAIAGLSGTIATTTNITAATGIVLSGVTHTGAVIPTVTTTTTATNLTNAPTSGDLTATMKTSVTTAATAATPIAASVAGAVGSVTAGVTVTTNNDKTGYSLTATTGLGNQTANITGTITTVTTATNVTTVNGLASNVITAASIAADAVTEIQSGLATPTNITAASGIAVASIGNNVITAASLATDAVNEIVDQTWDELTSGHAGVGSTGAALSAAGGSGDPWSTALPGAYGAGTAGKIIGDNINAAIDSRMASYTQPTGFLAATFPATVASTTNITGGTITTATNVTTVNGLAANVITASSLATDAVTEIVGGVWNAATSAYGTAGSYGEALEAAGTAADPWLTALPGAYAAGTAGYIIGNDTGGSITVVPLTGVVESRVDGTTIIVFTSETVTVSVACVDAEGDAVDVSAMTLEIIIENQRNTDIVVIPNASITKVTSTFSFAVPISVSGTEGNYQWALRKTTDDSVLMTGPFIVMYAPQSD